MTVLFIAVAAALIYVFVIMPGDSDDASSKLPPSSNISSEIISSDESSSSEESANIGSIKVLDFTGKKYQEIVANIDYSRYNFVIETKQYNDDYSAYRVISQSPAAGEMVDPDTEDGKITLKLTVSLGNNYVTMPNVVGMSRTEAELTLFKAGFSYVNISPLNEIYDSEKPAQCIVSTSPKAGDKVNLDTIITMTFNTYVNDTPSGDSTESSQSNE
jgi:beta-lactam-binding protein with PASTA domain